ncbi:MAG TPA: 2Fe-2S iron-sulfur cluster-binding protein [Burkholderiaceae bacterium]|nr:2Fe-2S iron-sulfur cluster-binding protein [Burkholderiaceae bacterium]
MPEVIFIHPDGRRQSVAAADGASVMQTATGAGVAGIVAECGGSAMCATCHVYVDPEWADKLPTPLGNELEMLECTAADRLETSRLSCQIKVTPALNGIVVRIPERQQ